jgi:hypothetical protein
MARRIPDDAHGVSEREQHILDLHEIAGMDPAAIAAELGVAKHYVVFVCRTYNGSWSQNVAFDRMVQAGSAMLARAIAATGKQWA